MRASWRPRRLVLVGSVIADVMMSVPRLPERGGDVLAGGAVVQAGGGFVVLAAARRLGLPVVLAGHVGHGPFGAKVAQALTGLNVEILLPRPDDDTGFCVGLIEPDGERTFVTSPGVEAALSLDELHGIEVCPYDAVYVSGYDLCYPVSGPAVAQWTTELGDDVLLVLDPGPLVGTIPQDVLTRVLARTNVLTANAREARLLGGEMDADAALLRRMRTDSLVVLRDGHHGCTLYGEGLSGVHVPAPDVEVVDTTGAGDTHTGALLAELSRGGDTATAARNANIAAGLSVTQLGSATCPDRERLERFIAEMSQRGG